MSSMPGVPREWASQLGGLVEQLRYATIAIQARANSAAAEAAALSSSSGHPAATAAPPCQPANAAAAAPQLGAQNPSQDASQPAKPQHSNDSQREWGQRVLELAFSDGVADPSNAGARATPNTISDGAGGQTAENGTSEDAATAVPHRGKGDEQTAKDGHDAGEETDDDDDDMASVCEDEFRLRDGESEHQRKRRVAVYLKAREKERRDRKLRERDREARTERGRKEAGGGGPANKVRTDAYKKK
jgi:hypothetical protein